MSEFQQELVAIAKALRIKPFEASSWTASSTSAAEEAGKTQQNLMTIGEANFFIQEAVSNFMSKGRTQLRAGRDPDTHVEP